MFFFCFFAVWVGVWFGGPSPIHCCSEKHCRIVNLSPSLFSPHFSCFLSFGFRPKGLSETGRRIAAVRPSG